MSSRQPSADLLKRADALQQLQAKRERQLRLIEQQQQQQQQQQRLQEASAQCSNEEELLDDFSSPEKPVSPPSKSQAPHVKPKGLNRLRPASVDGLTSSLNRMQISGAVQQQRQAPDAAGAAAATKPLQSSPSGSINIDSGQEDDGDDDGASGNEDGNRSAESVEDSDEDVRPKTSASTNAMRKLLPSSGGQAGSGQQERLQASSRVPLVASNTPATAASPDDLVLGDQQQYRLGAALYRSLYTHQVDGVKWLWSLFAMGRGGILGDDMGLGKTMQCAAFLAGLLNSRLGKRAMVVAPKTLLMHWHKELSACGLGHHVHAFYGDSASERAASLNAATGVRLLEG